MSRLPRPKIVEHGQRADGIVRGMLEHSRGTSGERRTIDLKTLVDEALNLAHHGARFSHVETRLRPRDRTDELAPQEMTRVLLNLFSKGFYAATRRARSGTDPTSIRRSRSRHAMPTGRSKSAFVTMAP
jgi:hypothetical protein